MKTIHYISLYLAIAFSLMSTSLFATHDTNEKYDGTIHSFRWLKQPIDVSSVTVRKEPGEQVQLAQFKGKIVMLNLWASWCAPCIQEIPALDRLQKSHGGDDFTIVPVTIDVEPATAKEVFTQLKVEALPFYKETADAMAKFFPVDVLPTNIIIGRDGKAIGLLRSTLNWDDDEAKQLISRLIEGVNVETLRSEKLLPKTAE
jgi:thiol-disulfide isomerase/thioredoxin